MPYRVFSPERADWSRMLRTSEPPIGGWHPFTWYRGDTDNLEQVLGLQAFKLLVPPNI
jgi:hypothetical protein